MGLECHAKFSQRAKQIRQMVNVINKLWQLNVCCKTYYYSQFNSSTGRVRKLVHRLVQALWEWGLSLYRSDDVQAFCETCAPHLLHILISTIVSADGHATREVFTCTAAKNSCTTPHKRLWIYESHLFQLLIKIWIWKRSLQ